MLHKKLREKYFTRINDGIRHYDLRLEDEGISKLKVGDEICFIECTNKLGRKKMLAPKLLCKVERIKYNPNKGDLTKEELEDLKEYYGEKEMDKGVLVQIWLVR